MRQAVRSFSSRLGGAEDDQEVPGQFSNKYRYESEVKAVLAKLERALALITRADPSDPRKDRIARDLA